MVRAEQVGRSVRCAREAWYRARGVDFGKGNEEATERLLNYGRRREAEYFAREHRAGQAAGRAVGQASGLGIWVWIILLFLVLVCFGALLFMR